MANIIKAMGVGKGDRVTIYLPRIPEIVLRDAGLRQDRRDPLGDLRRLLGGRPAGTASTTRESKLVITADGSLHQRQAWSSSRTSSTRRSATARRVENVIVVKRTGHEVPMDPRRDHWYHDLCALPIANGKCATESMDAEDPLYILYTSGSTGKPKAILHTHGGYMVGTYTTLKYVFDINDEDRFWCTADPGWVTGHSYLVYGPLLNGATVFMFEGGPTYPYPNRWWQLIERYGITIFYTAPTAIRALMRFGEAWPNKHDLSSLRLLGSVGEPINPEAWKWFHRVIGKERCPIMDTWWQTETGMFMITPDAIVPLKPGSGTRPFFGQEAEIVDEEGKPVPDGDEGLSRAEEPVAGHDAHHLRRRRALRRAHTGANTPAST